MDIGYLHFPSIATSPAQETPSAEVLAGVWIGFDEKRSLGEKQSGGRVAAPIWLDFMQTALADKPVPDFPVPEGVVFVRIDPRTGLRALPNNGRAILECFKQGTEPQVLTRIAVESGSSLP